MYEPLVGDRSLLHGFMYLRPGLEGRNPLAGGDLLIRYGAIDVDHHRSAAFLPLQWTSAAWDAPPLG